VDDAGDLLVSELKSFPTAEVKPRLLGKPHHLEFASQGWRSRLANLRGSVVASPCPHSSNQPVKTNVNNVLIN
jgi:hypothetical protein